MFSTREFKQGKDEIGKATTKKFLITKECDKADRSSVSISTTLYCTPIWYLVIQLQIYHKKFKVLNQYFQIL